MDNVTHTMIGFIAGEAVFEHSNRTPRKDGAPAGLPERARQTALVAVGIAGSNLPDLDLLWSLGGGSGNHLDYMLRHRGYTHTIIGCAALALLLYACAEMWLLARRFTPSALDRALLFGTATLTTALHLAMDYLNSYGIHPFWPADNRWFYGDSVFIVEPLFWMAAAPLVWRLKSRLTRGAYVLAMVAVLATGAVSRLLTPVSFALLALGTAALWLAGGRMSAAAAARLSVGLALTVTVAFVAAGQLAARGAESLAATFLGHEPDALALDHVLTATPANPFCWDVWILGAERNRYTARRAVLSIAPSMETAQDCPVSLGPHTATLATIRERDSAGVRWLGEYSIAVPEFLGYATATCDADAFMQFSRAPFARAGIEPLLGDLRFDHGRERGSFEIGLGAAPPIVRGKPPAPTSRQCPRAAPWMAPRADLLDFGSH